MAGLFEYNTLAGMELRNRAVRSATYEGMASDDGLVTAALISEMAKLTEGETGLIISGHTYVSEEGKASQRKLAADRDECIPGLRQMADAVHHADGKIVIQLAHAGAMAMDAASAVGPSPLPGRTGGTSFCHELSPAEIALIVEKFIAAAERVKQAGDDGVQIHAAHGYLLSEFLSPHYNKRHDEYGGNVENRARIVIEILRGIKRHCGNDFPVMIKINSEDFIDDGAALEDTLSVCAMLEANDIDAIEFSGGSPDSRPGFDPLRKGDLSPEQEGYYLSAARQYKQRIKVPLILVGGIRSAEIAEQIIANGNADYIAFSRPLIREPDLIKRWRQGDRRRAKCISCNLCMRPVLTGKGLICMVEERLKRKK